MEKTSCILGVPPLAELLNKYMKQRGYEVFLGLPEGSGEHPHTWNPRSPISTRALITEACRSLQHIDDIILVCSMPDITEPFPELSARSIESSVDIHLKGPLFLIREGLNTLSRQGDGCLNIVMSITPASGEHPVGLALRKAVTGFTDSIFTLGEGGVTLHGFQGVDIEPEEYAENIIQAVTEKQKHYHGRWHRFGAAGGLLSSLPFGGRKK